MKINDASLNRFEREGLVDQWRRSTILEFILLNISHTIKPNKMVATISIGVPVLLTSTFGQIA